jgi:hypothetical protein
LSGPEIQEVRNYLPQYTVLANVGVSYSQTKPRSKTSNSIGSTPLEQEGNRQLRPHADKKGRKQTTATTNRVSNGTWANALRKLLNVDTNTSAASVAKTIGNLSANRTRVMLEPRAKRPRYTWGLLWDDNDDTLSATAQWSLTAEPVPSVPEKEYKNYPAVSTINSHPHLFKITMPIKVASFKALLVDHPNQPFVESVCRSLRTGFWPHADTHHEMYPVTWDNSYRPVKTQAERDFLESQMDKEVASGRYSADFGPDLLPGMHCSPIHTVPKPGTDTF